MVEKSNMRNTLLFRNFSECSAFHRSKLLQCLTNLFTVFLKISMTI